MPQINEERRKFESAFLNDYWNFRKEYWEPVNTDEYWDEVMDKLNGMAQKYGFDKYVQEVLLLAERDIEFRAMKKAGYDTKRYSTLRLLNDWRSKQGLPPVEVKRE